MLVIQSRLRLRKPFKIILYFLGFILLVFLGLFIYFNISKSNLMKLGYTEKASYNIITKFKKDFAVKYPNNKTLNAAFESDDYKEENLDVYTKVKYQDHKNIIKSINLLIDKKYSTRDISIILAHGNDSDVLEFAKKDKIKYLEEFYSYDYAKIKNYDRYIAHMDLNGDDEETTIIKVNMNIDKEDYTDAVLIDDYNKTVIANKHFYLGKDYIPKNLISFPDGYSKNSNYDAKGEKEAVNAAIVMIDAARSEGYDLRINSAYRSYDDQVKIYDSYLGLYGQSYVDNYVSKPGYSEHQTGYAFDFASGNNNVFENSNEYKWMIKNSYKYGFVYRFLKSKEEITEIKHEAWHFRYVGKEIAEVMDKKELCFEEYYAMYLDK